jgi:hypothetical protein
MINNHIWLNRLKRIIVNILAVIGLFSICITIISHNQKSFLEDCIEEFGTKDRLIALVELYRKVLSEQNPEEAIDMSNGFPITKIVPADWIPEVFGWWGQQNSVHPWWGDVLAYYDKSEKLIGIEFYGSRRGCFISEDPKVCPSHAGSLERISSYPLYVSIRKHYSHPRENYPIQDLNIQEYTDHLNGVRKEYVWIWEEELQNLTIENMSTDVERMTFGPDGYVSVTTGKRDGDLSTLELLWEITDEGIVVIKAEDDTVHYTLRNPMRGATHYNLRNKHSLTMQVNNGFKIYDIIPNQSLDLTVKPPVD